MKQRFLCAFGILLALLFCVNGQQTSPQKPAPKSSFEYEPECGDPTVESMSWTPIDGTVVEIIAGDLVKLRDNAGKERMVNLVAIEASSAKGAATSLLSQLVLDRNVEVIVNPTNSKSHMLVGVLQLAGKDINRQLLEAGAVQYKSPAAYSVSNYTACVYRIVERNAREAGKGMWQRANP